MRRVGHTIRECVEPTSSLWVRLGQVFEPDVHVATVIQPDRNGGTKPTGRLERHGAVFLQSDPPTSAPLTTPQASDPWLGRQVRSSRSAQRRDFRNAKQLFEGRE